MRIALIGAGNAGTSLAVRWRDAGHAIVAVSGRDATVVRAATHLPGVPVVAPAAAAAGADLVVLGVPDAAIAETAAMVGPSLEPGAWLCHLSGATGPAALGALPHRLAIHPLQTFPAPRPDRVPGCTFAVSADDEEGFALGEALARDAGGLPFRLRDEDRALYHAGAVFASNHVVATSVIAERLLGEAGIADPLGAMAPLQRATVENVAALGPARALTGPAVRGDVVTIEANLGALAHAAPDAVPAYVVWCRVMADVALASGRLDPSRRAAVDEALAPWS